MDTLFDSDSAAEDPGGEHSPGGSPKRGPAGSGEDDRPLAARMRPQTLADFVGQSHLLGTDSALRTAIEQGHPHSMILYGPPGTGKTTLARMVAEHANAAFEELSAVQAGRAEVRAVLERAAHRREMKGPPAAPGADGVQGVGGTHTVFFLDEIHRFNKAQQDALLPAVEEGLVTLIGATTENPAFEVNGALLSRTRVYALQALSDEEIVEIMRRAIGDATTPSDGAAIAGATTPIDGAAMEIEVDDDALDFLGARSVGDARTALNALELALATAAELGETRVTIARAEDALQQRAVLYDKGGDRHYDYISAWIKATRGSNPDASLYYLAVMLEGGEDPRFIVRRMVILASEDIGNADPAALTVAVAASRAVEHVGLPEATYALAQAAIYLALAPKSNAAGRALGAARRHVREHGAAPVPGWLRSGPRPGQEVGGYDNPHGHPGHLSEQELLPEGVVGERFYEPDEAEAELARRLELIRELRGR
jgi:putative ATPase